MLICVAVRAGLPAIVSTLVTIATPAMANPDTNPNSDPDGDMRVRVVHTVSTDARVHGAFGMQLAPALGSDVHIRGFMPAFVLTGSDPEGDAPSDVKYTQDGSRIVIAHRESRNLIVWDASTFAFIGAAPVSGAAQALDITPDGSTAVVANIDNDTVSIVDLNTFTETAIIPVGANPGLVAISPAGDLAAIGVGFDSEIVVIDIASATVVRTIPGISYGSRLSFSFEGPATSIQYTPFAFVNDDRLINIDPSADEAQFVNVRTGNVIRIAIPAQPRAMAVSGDRSRVAISHAGATRFITLLDTASGTVSGGFGTPIDLWGPVALNTDGSVGVFAVQNAARVVDLNTGAFGANLNTASINEFLPSFDGRYAIGVGFRGAVIDLMTGSMATQVNNVVSTEHGATSPVAYRAAMCSTTFGDDLVIADIEGALGSLLSYTRSGPEIEGDRCRTVAVSPDGTRAVGVSLFSDNAAVVSTASGTLLGSAPIGERPSAVAITPDGTRAVVGNLDSSFASIVDLATATTTNVNISRRAGSVAISKDSVYAYLGVVASGDGVWRINLNSNTVEGPKLLTGNMGGVGYGFSQSSGISLSHDGDLLAVAGSFDDVVTLIDTGSWSVIADLPSGDFPAFTAFSPDDSRLYAINKNDDSITVYDNTLAVPTVIRTISVGDQPWHVAEDGRGGLWVNNWGDSEIAVYDINSGALFTSFPFADRPVGLVFDEPTGTMRVAHGTVSTSLGGPAGFSQSQNGAVSSINIVTLDVTEFDMGVGPSAMAQSTDGQTIGVAAPIGDGLVVLRIDPSCSPADLAEPFGVVNFFDVVEYIALFNAGDPGADLAAPFGTLNFFDVVEYIALFNAGCP